MCLCMWTVLNMWSPKHSSFLCRLTGSRAPHSHHFRRPPTAPRPLRPRTAGSPQRPDGQSAWGRTPLHLVAAYGHVVAAELLLSKGAAVDATNINGPGLNPGSRRQTSSLRLGHLRRLFRDWNLGKTCLHFQHMFGKVVSFQCNMPICVESGWSDLQMEHKSQDGQLSSSLKKIFVLYTRLLYITYFLIKSNVVKKMYWSLSNVFVKVNSFEDVKSKTFIVRLSVERVELRIPTTFVVRGCWHLRCCGPGNHLRHDAAAPGGIPRPRRGCRAFALKRGCGGRQEERWRGASIREAGARHRVSDLGHLRRLFRDWNLCISGTSKMFFQDWNLRKKSCIFRKCLAKLWVSTPKNAGIGDHNITCQYVWKTDAR